MHYQVVAKPRTSPAHWEYYPYWAPGRDKAAAERLARFAAQSGYEAAIVQSVTLEMLEQIAQRVVERQDTQMLPALRYTPGASSVRLNGRREHDVDTAFLASAVIDPYHEGPDKAELDRRRLAAEIGPGGDVTTQGGEGIQQVSFPGRMDVLSAWLTLRQRVVAGQIGMATDGVADDDAAVPRAE